MNTSDHLTPGMFISVDERVYRVEACVKVAVLKGSPFIKATLKDLTTDEVVEKNFKLKQPIKQLSLTERKLEYLYIEDKEHIFLDVGSLDLVSVPFQVIGEKINLLKEATQVKAVFYGDSIFSIELPQFLELKVKKVENPESSSRLSNSTVLATLETGAVISVPMFIVEGDDIKIDTISLEQNGNGFIQRV